jgi:hypothetical protein
MRIIANEIGVFKARFMGFKPCKNIEYVMVKLQFTEFEVDGETSTNVQPQTVMILHDAVNMGIFQGINEGQLCHFKMSVGYQAPNNRDGKSYPGGVKFRVLQAAVVKE